MTIALRGLTVRGKLRDLVSDVSLTMTPGSCTALVGASGAGKSLICAALAGTLPPGLAVTGTLTVEGGGDETDGGSSRGCGGDAAAGSADSPSPPDSASLCSTGPNLLGLPAAQRPRDCRIALVAQDHSTALHPLIPVGRQIALAVRAGGARSGSGQQRAAEMLRSVGLDAELGQRVPGRLSGGQRQRAALALALAARLTLLIADEPTTALDVVARAEILDLLSALTRQPSAPAMLLVTHDLPAATISERIAVLSQGRVVESGDTRAVLARPEHPVTVAMRDAAAEETIDGALSAALSVAARAGRMASVGLTA